MILVDTSIWVDHFRQGDRQLADLLNASQVILHPFVTGELALGHLHDASVLTLLDNMPQAAVASTTEIRHLIGALNLSGRGIGYVDTHLLASTRLTPGTALWTRDKRLAAVALREGLAAQIPD